MDTLVEDLETWLPNSKFDGFPLFLGEKPAISKWWNLWSRKQTFKGNTEYVMNLVPLGTSTNHGCVTFVGSRGVG